MLASGNSSQQSSIYPYHSCALRCFLSPRSSACLCLLPPAQVFQPLLAVFAAILIASSYKLLAEGGDEEDSSVSCRKFSNRARTCNLQ